MEKKSAYITSGEVTTLKHEARYDTMKARTFITEAFLAGAESAEVGGSAWNHVVIEIKNDPGGRTCMAFMSMLLSGRREMT